MNAIKRIILIICSISILFFSVCIEESKSQREDNSKVSARVFYVATNGNDQWTGTLAEPNSLGIDGPFATLQKARNTIREQKRNGSKEAFTVLVRGGIYQLNETFTLGPEDSGTASSPTVFKAYDNEQPTLIGSKKVGNFEPYREKIFKASLKGLSTMLPSFRQLFSDGRRQILARYPNFDPLNPIGGGFLYIDGPVEKEGTRAFRYKDDLVNRWTSAKDAEVFIFPGDNWASNILPVLSIDRENRIVALSKNATHALKTGNRYYFQDVFEELDSPGEWYFDQREKNLYFWPVNETSLNAVSVPVIRSILEIKAKNYIGRLNVAPTYITFEGFTMKECEGSAVVVSKAKNVVIAKCTISQAGRHGVEINDGFQNIATGNDIYDIGGTGIAISAGDRKTLTPANNRAENNHIHDTGVFDKSGVHGILCRGVGNIVAHNLIHETPRVGIWIDGNDHLVEYNHIHHVNRETEDSGAIYFGLTDWTKRGNIVRFNYIHHSGGYGRNTAGVWTAPLHTYGIYLDDWTSGATVYGNIVANTVSGGIFIHSGRDNVIENNIIVEGGNQGQMVYSAWLPDHPVTKRFLPVMFAKIKEMAYTKYPLLSTITDINTGAKMSGNSFMRNIIYYTGKDVSLYGIYNDIDLATTSSDHNVIYHAGLPLLVPFMKVPADRQWKSWQDRGLDQHSIIADPLFSDLARGDFTLSPASPALKIGFKPILRNRIGLYNDPKRASWPVKE
jgi:hypothetical protein